jgi:hypothetical protein
MNELQEAQSPVAQPEARERVRLSTFAGSGPRGLVCRKCGCTHFLVIYTRPIEGGIRRRRRCRHCGTRLMTLERM